MKNYRNKMQGLKRMVVTNVLNVEDVNKFSWSELSDLMCFLHKANSGAIQYRIGKPAIRHNIELIEERLYEIEFAMGEDL